VKTDTIIGQTAGPRMRTAVAAMLVASALLFSACSGQPLSTREKGAAYGAVGGAATGAIIGAFTGNPGAGAAIGGGLGLLGGALIGNSMQNRETEQAQTQSQIQQQQHEIQRQQYEIQALRNQQGG
jgi:osmotically inducible lipoprotein OsmB